ncbi:MAG: aldehyde dehydrogenase EutE [Verrucomicrobiae bacterium]|nr:aldehyde dehydrogenase EutE [Verrucomicrobiae bacterium]
MSSKPALDDAVIRTVVEEVLGRLGHASRKAPPSASTEKPAALAPPPRAVRGGRALGVFSTADAACEAAAAASLRLQEKGLAARAKVIEIVKGLAEAHAAEWGRLELEETKIGRLDHKIAKLQIIKLVPGLEFLRPYALSGDHGITHEEYTPFGVIGAVTPSTHSIPTISGNIVSMVAAGNAVVFNPHPSATRCAATAVRAFNAAIERETGIADLVCLIERPTIESFKAMCANEGVRLLCVTGGPGVVKAAMQTGKRAVCAGPGNPPVLVDDTADLDKAAQHIIQGAAFDNNLLCIGEKEIFVLDTIADALMSALAKHGAARLDAAQLERLTKAVFSFSEGQGAGCPHPVLNKDFVGKDASVLAKAVGVAVSESTPLLFAETDAAHPFVVEEQMTPFIPIVRVRSIEEGIAAAKEAEHGYRHTAIIHSKNVDRMTAMARALDTTLFVKNGPCMAGLGLGGEGYLSYSIATPTGEGITNPRTFTRVRRCVMVDNLRIY